MSANETAIQDAISRYLSGAVSKSDTAEALSGLLDDVAVVGIAPGEPPHLSADDNGKLIELMQLVNDREVERHSKLLRVRRILAPRLQQQELPANSRHFCQTLALLATAKDGIGEHEQPFQAFICTPSWINEEMRERRWTWFAPTLVVEQWDISLIRESISALARTTTDISWQAFQEQLMGRFAWESLRIPDVNG